MRSGQESLRYHDRVVREDGKVRVRREPGKDEAGQSGP